MKNDGFVLLDTKAIKNALAKKDDLIKSYEAINKEYDSIVDDLLKDDHWKGRGATAFKKDATTVKTNIVGIFEILKVLCDTLTDCLEIFEECDKALGEYNQNPDAEK